MRKGNPHQIDENIEVLRRKIKTLKRINFRKENDNFEVKNALDRLNNRIEMTKEGVNNSEYRAMKN